MGTIAVLLLATACGSGDDPGTELRSSATSADPADEAGYLDALRQREPDRATEFADDELVELGHLACELTDGYVSGSSPNPGDELAQEMVDRGHDSELTDAMTSDIRNSMEGRLCDIERGATG